MYTNNIKQNKQKNQHPVPPVITHLNTEEKKKKRQLKFHQVGLEQGRKTVGGKPI